MTKTASQMGKAARNKGKVGEREVAHLLQKHGFSDSHRTQQFSGKEGTADVVGLPGFHIEVKRQETYRINDWCQQAEDEARQGETPIVVFRRSNQPWRVIMDFERFLSLMAEYQDVVEELDSIEK